MESILTPHNFILHLRVSMPELARLLDGARSVSLAGGVLEVKAPVAGWPGVELFCRERELAHEAANFFGPDTVVSLLETPPDPERLPSPVLAGKVNNHVALWVWDEHSSVVLVARKPDLEKPDFAETAEKWSFPHAERPEDVLPAISDKLLHKMREEFSYVHIIAPFPGHETAGILESRLYAVKEWGTPISPAPLLQRFVGRLHFSDPENPPSYIARAKDFLSALRKG